MKKVVSLLVVAAMLLAMVPAVFTLSITAATATKVATVAPGYIPFDENKDGKIDSGVTKITNATDRRLRSYHYLHRFQRSLLRRWSCDRIHYQKPQRYG